MAKQSSKLNTFITKFNDKILKIKCKLKFKIYKQI